MQIGADTTSSGRANRAAAADQCRAALQLTVGLRVDCDRDERGMVMHSKSLYMKIDWLLAVSISLYMAAYIGTGPTYRVSRYVGLRTQLWQRVSKYREEYSKGESVMSHTVKKLLMPVLLFVTLVVLGEQALSASTPAPPCDPAQVQRGCLYFPSDHYTVAPVITDTIIYTDIAGLTRSVRIAIRIPITAPVPLPVVIWSHGGAEGHTNPAKSMVGWSETTAEAGYLTISIAHSSRTDTRRLLCNAIMTTVTITETGYGWDLRDEDRCEYFKYLNWDRPYDIRAVLDALERMNAQGALQGRIDLAHIAVGGHSSGSSGALTVGGALRNFTGASIDLSDPEHRPAAYLAFSPQQPGSEGFFDTDYQQPIHSWISITSPVLFGTGDGDNTCDRGAEPGSCYGETPYGRRIAFERIAPREKYRIYFHDADTFHELFALNTDNEKCGTEVTQQKCDEIARTLRSVALAFLDDHLRGNMVAQQWLGRNDVELATGGVAEWSHK